MSSQHERAEAGEMRELKPGPFEIGLNAVIVAVTEETPRVLAVQQPAASPSPPDRHDQPLDTLPYGPLHPQRDRTLELGLRGWVREQTGIELGYVEQLYTFGDRNRAPDFEGGVARIISVAYLALVRETVPPGPHAHWRDCYAHFPWEDWREGRPHQLDDQILPALDAWQSRAPDQQARKGRRERIDIAFGCRGASWNWERVLDRYELLYEAGLVAEALRGRSKRLPAAPSLGRPMLLDHRRILATALDRIRGKLRYRPVVFELIAPQFTLLQLQRLVEALAGFRLHKQNFRRLVEKAGLVEGTHRLHHDTGGRPAELFRFRREVIRERPAPGVGLPSSP